MKTSLAGAEGRLSLAIGDGREPAACPDRGCRENRLGFSLQPSCRFRPSLADRLFKKEQCNDQESWLNLHIYLHTCDLIHHKFIVFMVKSADTADLKSAGSNPMGVQVPLRAPNLKELHVTWAAFGRKIIL
jgi:hypothetical protein